MIAAAAIERTELSQATLAAVSTYIENRLGLHFPSDRYTDLKRAISMAADELNFDDPSDFAHAFLSDKLTSSDIDHLTGCLTVGETYFLRDRAAFTLLSERILPELVARRRDNAPYLRLWSAACCTGEEPYSLAIMLDRMLPDRERWNITILATDINPAFLRRARKGVYRPWSFRSTPDWLKRDYFTQASSDTFRLREDICRMVTFDGHNLAEDTYPSPVNNTNAMDVIFCRNVLIYFNAPRATTVVQRLTKSLAPGGHLFLGAAEYNHEMLRGLQARSEFNTLCYRKATGMEPVPPQQVRPSRAPATPKPPPARRRPSTSFGRAARKHPEIKSVVSRSVASVSKPEKTNAASLELIRNLANQGSLTESFEEASNALEKDKTSVEIYLLRAGILRELGRDAEAQQDLKRCLYLDPDHIAACIMGAQLAMKRGDKAQGQRLFTTAARLLDKQPDDLEMPDSEGLTAGQMKRMLAALLVQGQGGNPHDTISRRHDA